MGMKDKKPIINQFLFQAKYLEDVKQYCTEEDLKELCYGIVMNGLYGEDYISERNPILGALLNPIKSQVNSMNNRYQEDIEHGKKGGRPSKVSSDEVKRLALEGKKSPEIAAIFGVSDSAVRRSKGWTEAREILSGEKNDKSEKLNVTNLFDF